jgi:cell division protease FtsH
MVVLVLVALAASVIFRSQLPGMATTKDMDYSTFYTDLTAGKIEKVTTSDSTATVILKGDKTTYDVTMPARWLDDSTLTAALHKASEPVNGKAGLTWIHSEPWFSGNMAYLLSMLIPLLLLGAFWIFIMKQSQAGAGQAMSFGKSRARRMNDSQPKVTFADVAGVDEAKQELTEIIDFLKNPEKFQALGAKIPKGVLLLGNPGTGKTLLARAVAGEAGVPFFHISGSDFVEMFVGVGASRVRDLFEQAKAHRPAIVFIDEIDAVGRHRGAGVGGGHDEREQTLNQLLVEMDGFDPNSGVILMAATNRPDVLDPALTRPGRFDRRIVVDNPDAKGRLEILKVHAKGKPIAENVDMDLLARRTAGFSGADLANLLNEAALLTARRDKTQLGESEFEESIERVVAGPERKSRIIQEREKSVLAYHEVGHALLGKLLPNTDSPHKVTILPRGMALGYTLTLPSEDRFLMSKSQMLDEITVLLGGRVAEQIVFNEITTGAQNDLERCTDIARRMVCEYGMTENLGPLTLGRRHGPVFLGRDMAEDRNYSEDVAEKIDAEIRSIVDGRYQRATDLLTENREILDRISVALLEKETISSEELDRLIAGESDPEETNSSESQPPTAAAPLEPEAKDEKETPKPAPGLRPGLAGV